MDTIEVLIAGAHRLVRAGFRRLLEEEQDITVVGEAARGEEALAEAQRLGPQVVLVDADLPGMDALRASRLIFEVGVSRSRVLLLAADGGDAEVRAALRAGAYGVLLRDSDPIQLRRAARVVARGGAFLVPAAVRRLAADVASRRVQDAAAAHPHVAALTAREREVVGDVARGFSTREIAERLAVSPATVKTHIASAMGKLQARDRAQLVMLAYETGLVLPPG